MSNSIMIYIQKQIFSGNINAQRCGTAPKILFIHIWQLTSIPANLRLDIKQSRDIDIIRARKNIVGAVGIAHDRLVRISHSIVYF